MNVTAPEPMTVGKFLAWEERQELRHEFDGERALAMTGGTLAHDRIGINLLATLLRELDGKRCRVAGPNLKIEVAGRVRYPDAFVYCTAKPPGTLSIDDPVVIFEVLSDGTLNTDLVEKNREYRATASVRRYVVLEQTHPAGMVFRRHNDDWVCDVFSGVSGILDTQATHR